MVAWREVRNFKDGNKFKYRLCDGQAMGPVSNSSTRYGIIFISPVIELVIVTYTINKSIVVPYLLGIARSQQATAWNSANSIQPMAMAMIGHYVVAVATQGGILQSHTKYEAQVSIITISSRFL